MSRNPCTTKRTFLVGRLLAGTLFFGLIGGCAENQQAAPSDEAGAYRLVEAFPNLRFERPLGLAHAGDGSGRLFVVLQAGTIRVFEANRDTESTSVFLDIRARVRMQHNEEGLLALAFHPEYPSNGLFYVYYSASDPLRNVVSRFRVSSDPDRADSASETVLLQIPKPFGNHNGSTLVFGPDGFLYVSIGDGGAAGDPLGHGQNLGTLLGSILRIDVDRQEGGLQYAIPPDNPFVDRQDARHEIWAYGLRNVWRMSFDRETGDLWAGDVGQDLWEEVDLVTRGGNYGWNLREGRHRFREGTPDGPLIDPVLEYSHEFGASVTGGFVYRGPRLTSLRGAYLYADFVSGTIWAARVEGGSLVSKETLLRQPKNIASFGESPDGELYLLAFDGRIYELEETGSSE